MGDTYIETECDGILVLPELALRITEGAYRARNVPYSVMVSSTFYQRLKKQVEKKQNPSREALESFVQKLTQMTRIDRTDSVERVINKRASFENVGKQTLIDIAVIVNAYSGMLHRVVLDMISRIEEGKAVVPGQNIGVESNVNMDIQEALIREIEILFNKT